MEPCSVMRGGQSSCEGSGPIFQNRNMIGMDAIQIIEARRSKVGGLDFEANFESLFTSLVEEVLHSRVVMFQDLVENHKLFGKFTPGTGSGGYFGINVPLLG